MQFSPDIDGFRQNDSHLLLEVTQLYKQNPLENLFYFHYLPKLYIGFKAHISFEIIVSCQLFNIEEAQLNFSKC